MANVNLSLKDNENYSSYKHKVTGTTDFVPGTDTFTALHDMDVVFYFAKPTTSGLTTRQAVDVDCNPAIFTIDVAKAATDGLRGPYPVAKDEVISLESTGGVSGDKVVIARVLTDHIRNQRGL